MKNKKTVITIISIVAVLLVIIGVTYAYWLVTKTQTGQNIIGSGCLDISISGEKNDITLTNQFPMSDEDGMKLVPYEFTVTNNCTTTVDYHINLESIGNETSALKSTTLKAVINDNIPKKLYEYVVAETTIEGAYQAFTIAYGTLAGKSDATTEDEKKFNLRMWIDKDAPISEQNKTFTGKISVSVGQNINTQGETLASLVLEDAEEKNYLYTTTPDFTIDPQEGEYGLYKAQDDLGDSYYFRGDIKNNYVEFGKTKVKPYSPEVSLETCGEDESCIEELSVFGDVVFKSQEMCEDAGLGSGAYSSCKPRNIETVYYTGSGMEEEIVALGLASLESCISITGDEEACTVKLIPTYDLKYWRIVRINGDGTIRMIYDGTSLVENGVSHTVTIGDIAYNSSIYDAKYAGYTYDVNGVETDSTIKGVVDTWYEKSLLEKYGKYIADSIFCNDKANPSVSNNFTYFKAYNRLNANPALTCAAKNDKYTVTDIIGNGYLTYPIGLVTADEAVMAGTGTNAYLFINDDFLTMTPSYHKVPLTSGSSEASVSGLFMYYVSSNGEISTSYSSVVREGGVRPVINIKADVLFEGEGTIENPYKLVG